MLKVVVPVVISGIAIVGVVLFFSKNLQKEYRVSFKPVEPVAQGSDSAKLKSPEPQKAASLSAEERKKYSIKILNGSGITGEAQKLKVALEADGFTVSSSGNAATFDHTDTLLQVKTIVPSAFKEDLAKNVGKLYKVTAGDDLKDTDKEDVVVTIGNKKAE